MTMQKTFRSKVNTFLCIRKLSSVVHNSLVFRLNLGSHVVKYFKVTLLHVLDHVQTYKSV